ncbi:hypothetical protein [Tengunoibacter tsumagoiensis]|uniref:Uncharacterized protein n=1 Tax=Tengunoibacter tsumagoiensis TaxID=2014871 RepID=A0A402A4F9_9CHLR|nr:hypothetical protein [Tengunoibacter tsumagoiensis]GCE13885.1 hypothetical protein KTT_37440 [Tengunoibacter tsumagoiensis]
MIIHDMLVVGDKEATSVRLRTNVDLKSIPLADFIERVKGITSSKSMEL